MRLFNKIFVEASEWVEECYNSEIPDLYLYHSLNHTLEVTRNAEILSEKVGLSSDEVDLVKLAALFHDTGHKKGHKNHEVESVRLAHDFLSSYELSDANLKLITEAISDTKVPQKPRNIYSEILCDADLFYLSGKEFLSQAELLKKEWGLTGQGEFSKEKFYQISLRFFDEHHYHTDFGKTVLSLGKEKNRQLIIQLLGEFRLK